MCKGRDASAAPAPAIVLDCHLGADQPTHASEIGVTFAWVDAGGGLLRADLGHGWVSVVGRANGHWAWGVRMGHNPVSGDHGVADTQEAAISACGIAAARHDVASVIGHTRRMSRTLGDLRDDGPSDLVDTLPLPASWPEGVRVHSQS